MVLTISIQKFYKKRFIYMQACIFNHINLVWKNTYVQNIYTSNKNNILFISHSIQMTYALANIKQMETIWFLTAEISQCT